MMDIINESIGRVEDFYFDRAFDLAIPGFFLGYSFLVFSREEAFLELGILTRSLSSLVIGWISTIVLFCVFAAMYAAKIKILGRDEDTDYVNKTISLVFALSLVCSAFFILSYFGF